MIYFFLLNSTACSMGTDAQANKLDYAFCNKGIYILYIYYIIYIYI